MNKKFIGVLLVITIIAIVAANLQINQPEKSDDLIFHITLADPKLYQNGVFSDTFLIEKGDYSFRFVPNGDSPQILSISLYGENFEFSENFQLKGTLHETGISEYYTWDYDGMKSIQITSQKELEISINPNGNVKGSVSVDIIKN